MNIEFTVHYSVPVTRRQMQILVLPYSRSRTRSQPGVSSAFCTAVIYAMKSPPVRITFRSASVARTCA